MRFKFLIFWFWLYLNNRYSKTGITFKKMEPIGKYCLTVSIGKHGLFVFIINPKYIFY
jgi:hypothetical protein